ncbi:MAG: DUF92 domain-containing protein [Nitrososphaerota archaeon]
MNSILAIEMVIVLTILSLLSLKLRILDMNGTILSVVIGAIVYATIGRVGISLLIVFVVVAGLFTKMGYDRKSLIGAAEPRKGLRGWKNVAGNGLVAATAAIAYALFPQYSEALLGGFIGAVAAVFADTMSTEVGILQKGEPRLIIGFKKVNPGTPGGISLLGYLGALLSSLILILAYLPLGSTNPLNPATTTLVAVIAGLIGTTVDSIVGQLLQGLYRCEECGKIVEHSRHCGRGAKLFKGYRVIDNHVVNLICSLSGAIVGAAITLLFYSTA